MLKLIAVLLAGACVNVATSAAAQTPSPPRQEERRPPNDNRQGTEKQPETLGEKLEDTGGVIRPPATSAPDMRVPAPQPNIDPGIRVPPPAVPRTDPK